MDGFIELRENDPRQVPVRGRAYLAGADSPRVPVTIPIANDLALGLAHAAETPAEAAALCRDAIDARLPDTGALLFRGLPIADRAGFDAFMQALGYVPHGYDGGIAVRARDAGYALVASQEDPRITMAPHNEMAYLPNPPRKVFFFCAAAADAGGEVPINDIRLTAGQIPDEILARFERRRIGYHRYLPLESTPTQIGWMDTFGVRDRDAVDALMRDKGYDHRWLDDAGLGYGYVHDAFLDDPAGGAPLWFNQVTELNASYWRSHPLFPSDWDEARYPATTTYGDGEPIDPELVTELRAALWRTSRAVAMRPGDVLVLDNIYVQHGRFAFSGPRLHLVSLTD
ncbi:TauD/TfdA family dioxygenase [Burkholderia ubonensis]|uniref:TauD/TfdA family dioxygenase n=1 Tax=Burkholderia ubonensis TaxID=101571 RepID=UPI00075FEB6F|nr:TauD/TfdA family dioxygenase [Burkholderia ubonensis]KWI58457.1 peptide synthase [Burkholderia ubonensis]KWO72164.1 peptide synthase [Burkholderia ubonensis]